MRNFLIVMLGPTGVGKTDISIDLAEQLKCEIISADSRQFFREMTIGTAVPSAYQLEKISHHFIKFLSIHDYYSTSRFETDVIRLLPSLFSRNNLVLMTGGSALYIDAVCHGMDDIPDVDPEVRKKYMDLYENEGVEGLRKILKLVDPEHYAKVDLKNYKRILRALEIYETTGRPYSSFLKNSRRERDFGILKIGINRERKDLYNMIDSRVDDMIRSGLEDETLSLYPFRNLNALNTVGYKEFFDYFDGNIPRDKAIELIKRNSRRFAKRQMTWWNKDETIRWFKPDQQNEILQYIAQVTAG